MIDLQLADVVLPPAGHFYVERLAMPSRCGPIILPYARQEYSRAAEAVVRMSRNAEYGPGIRVILSGSVSRSITFGYGPDERTLWLCTPGQILARVREFPERMIEKGDPHTLRGYTSADHDTFAEAREKFDEGETQGL